MTRMSKSISLALINSSLILAGCSGQPGSPSTNGTGRDTRAVRSRSGGGSGVHYFPWYSSGGSYSNAGRSGGNVRRPGSAGAIQSGGFGTSGHAAGS